MNGRDQRPRRWRPAARAAGIEARHAGDGSEPEIAAAGQERAPDFVLGESLGRRVPPAVPRRRIDFDDAARRSDVEVSICAFDQAPYVRAHHAARDPRVAHQVPGLTDCRDVSRRHRR